MLLNGMLKAWVLLILFSLYILIRAANGEARVEEERHMSPFHKDLQMIIHEQEIRWPSADAPNEQEPINRIDCYQELTDNHLNFTMALPNDDQMAYRPCMIRIPTQRQIEILHVNLTDKRSNIKIVAGNAMDHAPYKMAYVTTRTPETKYGPFYVPCQWAYLIFESFTRITRETVYFRMVKMPEEIDVEIAELGYIDRCSKPTRNYAARHFYRPVTPKPKFTTPKPIDKSDPDYKFRPERYREMRKTWNASG